MWLAGDTFLANIGEASHFVSTRYATGFRRVLSAIVSRHNLFNYGMLIIYI
jgi:hypothetical protein